MKWFLNSISIIWFSWGKCFDQLLFLSKFEPFLKLVVPSNVTKVGKKEMIIN